MLLTLPDVKWTGTGMDMVLKPAVRDGAVIALLDATRTGTGILPPLTVWELVSQGGVLHVMLVTLPDVR